MLQYSIMNQHLYGSIGGNVFSMPAFSGGGRGSTAGMEQLDLHHWNTSKKAPDVFDPANRGGPLPTGMYLVHYIGRYKHFGECARLDPTISAMVHTDFGSPIGFSVTDREGFLIHGQGPKGSDGCIVPASPTHFHDLMKTLKQLAGPATLLVHSPGMNADWLEARGLPAGLA